MIDLELHYTKTEKTKRNKMHKEMKSLEKKSQVLMNKYDEYQKRHSKLYYETSKLGSKVIERVQKKCKHVDIVGPYDCPRDDCSGGHYRCRACGKAEMHDFRGEKK